MGNIESCLSLELSFQAMFLRYLCKVKVKRGSSNHQTPFLSLEKIASTLSICVKDWFNFSSDIARAQQFDLRLFSSLQTSPSCTKLAAIIRANVPTPQPLLLLCENSAGCHNIEWRTSRRLSFHFCSKSSFTRIRVTANFHPTKK